MDEALPEADAPRGFWSIWPFRLVLFFVVLSVTYLGLPGIATIFKARLAAYDKNLVALVLFAGSAALSIAAYRLLVRLTEKRKASELAFAGAIPQFLLGSLLGAGLFCIVYAVYFAEGIARYKGLGSTQGLGVALGIGIASGVCEELVVRGGVFRILEQGTGTFIALVVSSALFGLLHIANPGATLLSSAAIMLEAGILLAAAYALTRSLWLAIGLHFAWNFTEGGIFGAQVSGGKMTGLLDIPLSGSPLMTGGSFGPEASIPAIVVCTTAGLILLALAIRKGEWKPLQFRPRTR
ncbi:MAG: lysostaphin resistance A-like protein [Rhizomicrobium sp.]